MAFDASLAYPEPPAEIVRDLSFGLSRRYADGTSITASIDIPPPTVNELASAIRNLMRDGELVLDTADKVTDASLDELEKAILHFQKNAPGVLPANGILNRPTIARLLTRRGCGVT